ncbi:MAG: ribonuclease D, partial [Actinomycetes bacterium]
MTTDELAPDVEAPEEEIPALPLLSEPRDGVPEVVDTSAALESTLAALAAGHGPFAIDAERAGGYRYSQRA